MSGLPIHTIALIFALTTLPAVALSAEESPDLASAYAQYKAAIAQEDYETALIYARKADTAARKSLEGEDDKAGVIAYNLGAVNYHLERYRDSVEPLQRATEIYGKVYGPDAPENLVPVRKLGMAYAALADWPRAEKRLLQAVSIIELQQGREAEPIADLLIELVKTAQQQEAFRRSRNYGQRALYILDRSGKTRSHRSGRIHIDLVTAALQLGDGRGANQHMGWAIEIYEENFPERDPERKAVYRMAADVYAQTGKDPSARKYRRRAAEASAE